MHRNANFFLENMRSAGVNEVMDPTRLADAVERHGAALTLFARQWVDAPEDVVQEAFIKLACQPAFPEPVAPWLFRVVRNAALSAARSAKRRQRHETAAAKRQQTWFISPDDSMLDAATVVEWLGTLPGDQREVITLHLWGGLTFAEIASVVDGSTSGVYRLYQTGLETLRRRTQCLKD
jgi:RNA polymerase sigma factor (sigma-70 family)